MEKKNTNIFKKETKGPTYKTLLKGSKRDQAKPVEKLNYAFYNLLEKLVLNIELNEKEKYAYEIEKKKIDGIIHKIKI